MKSYSTIVLSLALIFCSCKDGQSSKVTEENNNSILAKAPASTVANTVADKVPVKKNVEANGNVEVKAPVAEKTEQFVKTKQETATPTSEAVLKNTNIKASSIRVGHSSVGGAKVDAVVIGGDPNEYIKNRKKGSSYTTVKVGGEVEQKGNVVNVVKKTVVDTKEIVTTPPSHALFNTLLGRYVGSNGMVNYAKIKSDGDFEQYLSLLQNNSPSNDWSRDEKLAHWINAYNAFTIKKIVDNYPLGSITDLDGGKPWDKKWIKIGVNTYSLNDIENTIIRPQFKEPRIHFAVNCAAISCPPLANQAFTASNLNSLLDKQTTAFINNSASNTLSAKKASISKIFEWYGDDFGSIVDFINKYSATKLNAKAKIDYKDYNWKLNKT